MKFKLPIGLTSYTVKFKKVVILKGSGEVFGFCDYAAKEIEICKEASKDVVLSTFVHECLHATFYELGYIRSSQNESLVEAVSQNIARAIRALPENYK